MSIVRGATIALAAIVGLSRRANRLRLLLYENRTPVFYEDGTPILLEDDTELTDG